MRFLSKARFFAMVLSIGLSACVNHAQQAMNEAYQNKEIALNQYVSTQLPAANAGKMKLSDYWTGAYNLAITDPVRISDQIFAKGANHMITIAQQYEAGNITKDQYEAERRNVQLAANEEFNQARAQFDAAQEQRRQANSQMMMQYYLQTRPVTTSCYGNTCTTR